MAHILKAPRRQTGALLSRLDGGRETEEPTLMCCHCQRIWVYRPGSGGARGWCRRCDQPVCGAAACMSRCAPWEMRMERIEAEAQKLGE